MKIELKNVKHSEFASHETNCFEATIYIDGKRAGTVSNQGSGGPHFYHPHTIEEAINAYARTLPKQKWNYGGEELEISQDADSLISDLLVGCLYARDLKRALARKIIFVSKDGILKESKAFTKDKLAAALALPDLPARVGSATILNFMPFDLALHTYRTTIAAGA